MSVDVVIDRAARLVEASLPGVTVLSIDPLEGGHSGETFVARLDRDVDGQTRVVVKSGRPGRPPVGRDDVIRQARVVEALAGVRGVRVPAVLGIDAGDPQQVVSAFVAGEAVEPVLDGTDARPALVAERAHRAARMLAELHGVDIDAIGLGGEPVAPIENELERWAKTMNAVDVELVPGGEDLVRKLRETIPDGPDVALVHGDYRLGNILCDGDDPTGIIDWEIWSITDRRIDLGWFLLFCDAAEFPSVGQAAPGMPSAPELRATYETLAAPVVDFVWFLDFARMKMAAIMAHNLRRHREGRHHDPFQERLPPTIASLIRRGLDDD